jgi:hypothetical protein
MNAVALSRGTSWSRPPMLAMRGVSKTFGRARVLNDVDLTLHSGEVHRCSARTARASRH